MRTLDAERAITAAFPFGLKKTIYFHFLLLDCDMMENEITKYVIPYFKGIKLNFF